MVGVNDSHLDSRLELMIHN